MKPILCLCPVAPSLTLATRVTILMHWKEVATTTNTARLATLILPNSEIRVRGDRARPMSRENLVMDSHQSLLLFPSSDSLELTSEYVMNLGRPVHLIVPDGSWRQARKVTHREPLLAQLPRVRLPQGAPSTYRLRKPLTDESVSTYEAISRALGVIEGAHVEAEMDRLFHTMVERILWSRGLLPPERCSSPIPVAALEESRIAGTRGGALPRSSRSQAKD